MKKRKRFKNGKLYKSNSHKFRVDKLNHIRGRCKKPCMIVRNIECNLTLEDMEYLWKRDKAYLLKKPSVDRLDNTKSYERGNCKFIEAKDNTSKGWRQFRQ